MPLHGKIVVIKRSGGDGTEFPLTATCLFGRRPDCDIRIQLPQVSKEHCRIDFNENKEIVLTNLSSVNPTRVNGEALQQSERLKHGDVITIIDRSFRFEYPPAPTPKKRSSTAGKTETLKVLQNQPVGDTVATESVEKSIPEESTDPHLKDGTNHDNIQRSLEKTVALEAKEDDGLLQSKTVSPFNDLYQMIKKSLDVKTPRKSSASVLETPTSRFCTPKPGLVKKNDGKPVISTEDKSTPQKAENTEEAGIVGNETPKSVKKQRRSFQVPSTEMVTPGGEEAENAAKSEATSLQRRSRTPPKRFSAGEVTEKTPATPKSPVRRRSKEAKPAVTKEQEEQVVTSPKREGLRKASPRNSGKVEKVKETSKKRKSEELVADKPQAKKKRVSFGGVLCPELFDKRLPPDSPLRKGATPRRSLCVPKPSQSLLRRASAIGVPKSKSTVRTPSPKRSSSSPKASPKTSQKSRSPSPKVASPAKKSPKSKTPSPKAASPATKSKSPPASDLDSSCSIKRVQGRFSVSHISTPSPIAEDAITDLVPLVTQTPKIPLRRRSACRETPSMANSAAKVVRRSGVSRASMKVKGSWANIVRFGQTKPQVVAPAKKTVNKKTTKKTEPKPKTPARKLKDHVSTGHADSPVTIVVGRAHKQKVVPPTGAAPKIVTNIALFKKNMKMDEDLTGISEMLKTPANEQKRISAFNVYNATKTPVGGLGTSVVEPSVLDTPEETGEMIVSPLSVTVKDKSYNSEAVQRLFNNNDEEASIVSDTSAMDESDRQQCVDLKTTAVATPKQKPEQQECLTGVKRIMRTPKQKAEPIEDLRGRLLKTPKQKPEQQECLTGVKRMMKTPRQEAEPLEMLKAQEEGAVSLDDEELTEQTGQVETNEVADKTPQDCDEDVAKELDFACEEPQDDVPTDVTADVSQVDMEKNSKEVVAEDHLEEVPSGHDNESSDAMETVSQSAVEETVSVEQPEVDTADEHLSEEQPEEETADEHLSEEQPKEETADEHISEIEQPEEETADEHLSEEQPKDEMADEHLSEMEQPKEEMADEPLSEEEQPKEEMADEPLSEEEKPKEETADEHLSEQPKEDTPDEPLSEEQQPKVETATVTEVDETATNPDHEKTKAEELKSAEAKQETAELSEEPVVSAPVRGRRGKKTEATAPPAVRQTTRGRNAKSQVCVSDQPEVGPEKAVETLETEIPTEAVSHQMSPIKESDSVPPAEEAAVKPVRGRKTKATPVEPQPEKKEVVSDESLTADAQPQKSTPAPGKPRRGRKTKPDAVEQNEVSEDTVVAVETKPQSPVRAKRGRNAKRGDEKLESSSVETTESQEPAKKLRRGQKTQQEQAVEDQAEIIQEVPTETEVVPEPESEQTPPVDVPNDANDSAAHMETAVLKPKRGRKAKQPEQSEPEQQDTHSNHSGDQADMAQENANEVCSDPQEVVASGSDDISPDAMETVPQAPVTESLPEVETTGKVTETLPAVALKKPGRGRKVKLVESSSAEDKQEAAEHSEEPVVSAPVRGRRGKKTEATAPPAVRQTTRGRNAKSQVCVSDQPEVGPEKAVETLVTEISEIKESDSAPAEEAAVKPVRGRKLKTTAEQPQSEPEKNEVVSDEPLTTDAQPQKSIPAPAKSSRGRKPKPDAVEQNEPSEETKPQSPVRAKRGRNAKQEEEKLESSSVETTESQEPAKKLRGKKAEKGSAAPRDVQAVEKIVPTEVEAPLIAEPVKTDEQATVTAKPRRGRKAKQAPESETLVESNEGQEVLAFSSTDKPKRVRRGKVTEEAEVAAVAPEEKPDHELEAEEKSNAEPDAPVIKQGRTRGVKTSVKNDILQAIPAKKARRGAVVPLEETNAESAESTVLVSEPASTSVEPAKRGRRAAAKPTADDVMVTSDQAKSSDELISAVVEDTKTSKRSVRWKEDSEETPVKAVRGRKSKLAGQVETGSKTVSADADQTEETDLSDTVVEAQPIKRARRGAKVADVDPASSVDKSKVKTVEADPQPKTRRGRSAKK